ncbi:F-box protein CPR1-like [Bidens hawaiensis]|uniref:F-box protein CPR1-like n=1 Tax=Bidens hawaiensis TaxID=980011 RepID=UPI00404AC28E
MSDNIPFEIQVEIIKRLPLKSLVQFRTVSKTWKSMIDDADFITHYSGQKEHLVVGFLDSVDMLKYVSFVDDDSFPVHKVSPPIPLIDYIDVTIGSSHGLLCLCGYDLNGRGKAVLWNPSIRKAFALDVPNVVYAKTYGSVLGFGVCRETTDPKIVKITYIDEWRDMESISCIPYQVEVFTLSAGVWRLPYGNLPRRTITFNQLQEGVGVAVNGILYWPATDRITADGKFRSMIVSFDMTSEEFREIYLPDILAHEHVDFLTLHNQKESLIVLQSMTSVWIMKDGLPKSFTKLFSIDSSSSYFVRGFKKTDAPVVQSESSNDGGPRITVAVYEHDTKRVSDLGINEVSCVLFVCTYIESLLLLDQPSSMLFDAGN